MHRMILWELAAYCRLAGFFALASVGYIINSQRTLERLVSCILLEIQLVGPIGVRRHTDNDLALQAVHAHSWLHRTRKPRLHLPQFQFCRVQRHRQRRRVYRFPRPPCPLRREHRHLAAAKTRLQPVRPRNVLGLRVRARHNVLTLYVHLSYI